MARPRNPLPPLPPDVLKAAQQRAASLGEALRSYTQKGAEERRKAGLEHRNWSSTLAQQYVNHCILAELAKIDAGRGQITLKGGNLWLVWKDDYLRPTRDLDLGSSMPRDAFLEAFRAAVESDEFRRRTGIVLTVDPGSISGIKEGRLEGMRIEGTVALGSQRIPYLVETTFCDDPAEATVLAELVPFAAKVAEHKAAERMAEMGYDQAEVDAFLADRRPLHQRFEDLVQAARTAGDRRRVAKLEKLAEWIGPDAEPVKLAVATPEYMLADKLHSLVTRGVRNSRVKDAYDIRALLALADGPVESLRIDRALAQRCIAHVFALFPGDRERLPASAAELERLLEGWASTTDENGVSYREIWMERRMPEWTGRAFEPGRDPTLDDAVADVVHGIARLGLLPGTEPDPAEVRKAVRSEDVDGNRAIGPGDGATDRASDGASDGAIDGTGALDAVLDATHALQALLGSDAAALARAVADGAKAREMARAARRLGETVERAKAGVDQQSEQGKGLQILLGGARTIFNAVRAVHVAPPGGKEMQPQIASRTALSALGKMTGASGLGRIARELETDAPAAGPGL